MSVRAVALTSPPPDHDDRQRSLEIGAWTAGDEYGGQTEGSTRRGHEHRTQATCGPIANDPFDGHPFGAKLIEVAL